MGRGSGRISTPLRKTPTVEEIHPPPAALIPPPSLPAHRPPPMMPGAPRAAQPSRQFPATALMYRNGLIKTGDAIVKAELKLADLFALKGAPLSAPQNLDEFRKKWETEKNTPKMQELIKKLNTPPPPKPARE